MTCPPSHGHEHHWGVKRTQGFTISPMMWRKAERQAAYNNSLLLFPLSQYLFPRNLVEKAMATHSSTLAWKIPWTEEPGRLQSMASRRVRHDWATSLSSFTFMHWRRKWQPTPVFLPGESQGQGSLMGCRLWGRTESDTTEATWRQHQQGDNWDTKALPHEETG